MRRTTRIVVDPDGRVEVRTGPSRSGASIDDFVRKKARWIIRQQDYFDSLRPRDPARKYISGETIRYLGRQYRLCVRHSPVESVRLVGGYLNVVTSDTSDRSRVRLLVRSWYRDRAASLFTRKADECLSRFSGHGIDAPDLQVRWMTRRWGSCTKSGRLILNPLLVLAPVDCVEYVIVHELCHLKHQNHGPNFYRLMSTVMNDWRRRRERLERVGPHLSL